MPQTLFLFLICSLISVSESRGFGGIPGDYCSTRSVPCCFSRNDDCTVPILGNHLCYCDVFCDRGENGNDCCPDFENVCRDSKYDIEEEEECVVNGVQYGENDKIKKNCQECVCKNNKWHCDGEVCLIQEDVLSDITNGRYS